MIRFCFIVNPVAGRRRGEKIIPDLPGMLSRRNVSFSIEVTRYHKEATLIAKRASKDFDVIVAVGGDGTVNEVANGIINSGKALGVVPIGSGNDFVKMFEIQLDLENAIDTLISSRSQLIDIGEICTYERTEPSCSPQEVRYFVNGVGIGFDAAVAHESTKMKHLRGLPLYLTAVFRTLVKFKTPYMQMHFNNLSLNGKHFLVALGNGTCAGGGFYLTPNAKVDDGVFDICAVSDVSIPRVLQVFPSALRGKHTKYPEVRMFKTDRFEVVSQDKLIVHADGEILSQDAERVEIKLMHKALAVMGRTRKDNRFP